MKIYSPEVCDNCAYNLKREISIANDLIVKLDGRSCQNAIFKTCAVKYIIKKYKELNNQTMNTDSFMKKDLGIIWSSNDKSLQVHAFEHEDGQIECSVIHNGDLSLPFIGGFRLGFEKAYNLLIDKE